MGDIGLNEHHHNIVLDYMRFSRHQRSQKLRTIERNFDDLKMGRLSMEDTFTADEVSDMLNGLSAVIKGDVESELMNAAHTNILLLRQVFSQAQKWHLKLQADISELENQELLDAIKSFEEDEKSGKLSQETVMPAHKLQPIHDSGAADLLKQEIERLNVENEKLKNRLRMLEGETRNILEQKSKLSENLEKTSDELHGLMSKQPEVSLEDVSHLKKQLQDVTVEMSKNLEKTGDDKQKLLGDLTSTKHKLLEVQEQLEMAEKELDKKFQQTAAYKNLKQMLSKKNEQIKELRKEMSSLRPGGDEGSLVD